MRPVCKNSLQTAADQKDPLAGISEQLALMGKFVLPLTEKLMRFPVIN